MQVDGYSLEGQKNMLTRFADREEMIVVDTYEDAGKSGKSIEGRPAFQKMLRDIEDGLDIDYILVYKLSRFGRNAADILNSLELVQSYGVNLICIEEGIDSSQTSGKLLISVLSAVAEIERENIIEQTMNGRREKARQGGWNGGFAPYGYTLEDNKLMIEETEAVAIRKIFELYTSSEIGLGGIANQLNLQGIRKIPRQNGTLEDWTGHFIKLILDNPVYCGKIAYGRRTKEKVKGTKNDYQMKRNDDYILTEGQHKGIVSEEVWEKAHAKRLRTGVKQPSKIGRDRVHLLSGLLKCPVCGSPMYTNKHAWTNKDGTYKEIYYYVCSRNRMVRGKHCEYKAMLKKTDIEPMVIEAIREIVRNEEYAQAIKKRIGVQIDTKAVDKELEGYQAKLKEVDLNKTRLEREIDSLPADAKYRERKLHDMTLRLDSLYDVIVELEEKIEDAKLRRDAIKQQAITLENIYKIMVNFDCVYNIINDEEKRNVVTALIKEIEIYRNDESEYPLKRIGLNFPVFKDGGEVTELLWDKGNTVETGGVHRLVRRIDYCRVFSGQSDFSTILIAIRHGSVAAADGDFLTCSTGQRIRTGHIDFNFFDRPINLQIAANRVVRSEFRAGCGDGQGAFLIADGDVLENERRRRSDRVIDSCLQRVNIFECFIYDCQLRSVARNIIDRSACDIVGQSAGIGAFNGRCAFRDANTGHTIDICVGRNIACVVAIIDCFDSGAGLSDDAAGIIAFARSNRSVICTLVNNDFKSIARTGICNDTSNRKTTSCTPAGCPVDCCIVHTIFDNNKMRLIIVSSLDIGYDTGHGVLGASNRNVISCHELIVDHVFCRYADDGGNLALFRGTSVSHTTIRHGDIANIGIFCPTNRGRTIFSSRNREAVDRKVLNDRFELRFVAVTQRIGFRIPHSVCSHFIRRAVSNADNLTEQAVVRAGIGDLQIGNSMVLTVEAAGEGILVRADGRPFFVLEVDVVRQLNSLARKGITIVYLIAESLEVRIVGNVISIAVFDGLRRAAGALPDGGHSAPIGHEDSIIVRVNTSAGGAAGAGGGLGDDVGLVVGDGLAVDGQAGRAVRNHDFGALGRAGDFDVLGDDEHEAFAVDLDGLARLIGIGADGAVENGNGGRAVDVVLRGKLVSRHAAHDTGLNERGNVALRVGGDLRGVGVLRQVGLADRLNAERAGQHDHGTLAGDGRFGRHGAVAVAVEDTGSRAAVDGIIVPGIRRVVGEAGVLRGGQLEELREDGRELRAGELTVGVKQTVAALDDAVATPAFDGALGPMACGVAVGRFDRSCSDREQTNCHGEHKNEG